MQHEPQDEVLQYLFMLQESEARFNTMADTAPVMMWMSGADKLCTFFNKGWLAFTGRSMTEELGNGWAARVHPDDFERCLSTYSTAFDERQPFEMEYRLLRHDGEYRWLLDRGVARFAADRSFLGYIGSCVDVTDRKQPEATPRDDLARMRAEFGHTLRVSTLGHFAASLAHELNQPLTAILANAQAAERLSASDACDALELRPLLADIVRDTHRANEMIGRMRTLLRNEEAAIAPVHLGNALREVALLVNADATLRGVRIGLDLDAALPPVCGDKVQLQQVMLNLLLNAFDATRDRAADDRSITVAAAIASGGMVQVAVRDSGSGLSGEALAKIFTPFFTSRREGLGMGLPISLAIITAFGGRLWAENNPDRGATFYFTVPAAVGAAAPSHSS